MSTETSNSGPATGNQDANTQQNAGSAGAGNAAATGQAAQQQDPGATGTVIGGTAVSEPPVTQPPVPLTGAWSGLQVADNQKLIQNKGWNEKPIDDVLTAYRELESKIGSSIKIPGADATDEEKAAYYTKIGVPENPLGYTLEKPADAKVYDDEGMIAFRAFAHEAKLTPEQAKIIHDRWVESANKRVGDQIETFLDKVENSTKSLEAEWGCKSGTPEYDLRVSHVNNVLRDNPKVEAELKSINALGSNGVVLAPNLIAMLSKVGKALYSEDSFAGKKFDGANNPFAGNTPDLLYAQGELIKASAKSEATKALTKQLVQAAGLDLKSYPSLK